MASVISLCSHRIDRTHLSHLTCPCPCTCAQIHRAVKYKIEVLDGRILSAAAEYTSVARQSNSRRTRMARHRKAAEEPTAEAEDWYVAQGPTVVVM